MKTGSVARDIRSRYRRLLNDDSLFTHPRATSRSHRIGWYLDGHLASRPLSGLFAYANFAEYLMHKARFGGRHQSDRIREAAEFFAETRRTMQNVLSTYPVGKPLCRVAREALARKVLELCERAKETYALVSGAATRCRCPACRNYGLRGPDVELLEAILVEQTANGTIPRTSALYRADHAPRTGLVS